VVRRRPEGGRKWAAGDKRFGEYTLTVWEACNPLKSHKTAKDMFGKAWTKTAKIWKSLRKCVGGRPHSAAFARPPRRRRYSIAAAFRMHTIVACAGTEPGCESGAAGRSDSARFPRRAGSGRNRRPRPGVRRRLRRHLHPQEREKDPSRWVDPPAAAANSARRSSLAFWARPIAASAKYRSARSSRESPGRSPWRPAPTCPYC